MTGRKVVASYQTWLLTPLAALVQQWDIAILVVLVLTAIVTPYEVAFLDSDTVDFLFVFNRLVDVS